MHGAFGASGRKQVPVNAPVPDAGNAELERIFNWRLRVSLRMGYTLDEAELIAESKLDLHELQGLIDAGCQRELAAKILL